MRGDPSAQPSKTSIDASLSTVALVELIADEITDRRLLSRWLVWGIQGAGHVFSRGSSATVLATVVSAVALAGTTVGITPATPRTTTLAPESAQAPVLLAAAINTSPTTLGIADSALYNLSEAEVNQTLDELQSLGVRDVRIAVPWVYVQPYDPRRTTGRNWTPLSLQRRRAT